MGDEPTSREVSRAQRVAHRRAVVRRRRIVAGVVGVALIAASVWGLVDLATAGGGSSPPPAQSGGTSSSATTTTVSCSALKLKGGVAVTRLRAADGSCEGARTLAMYTCPATPGIPAITASENGSTRRYLGGALATHVAGRPPGLVQLGAAGPVTIYRRRSTGAVYVRDHGMLTRWLTVPPASLSTPPRVYFLGDSVMLGAQPYVKGTLGSRWRVTFDAHVDRSTAQGLGIVTAHHGKLGDAAVVQLGTNDGGRPGYYIGEASHVLQALRGTPLVVWLTIAHARSYYSTDDHLLQQTIGRYPNTVLADWAAVAKQGDVYSDGLHLTPAGGKAMASLAASTLATWKQAALSAGAQACARRVAAA